MDPTNSVIMRFKCINIYEQYNVCMQLNFQLGNSRLQHYLKPTSTNHKSQQCKTDMIFSDMMFDDDFAISKEARTPE